MKRSANEVIENNFPMKYSSSSLKSLITLHVTAVHDDIDASIWE